MKQQRAKPREDGLQTVLDFYTRPGAMTGASRHAQALAKLSSDVGALAEVIQGLAIHQYMAEAYGFKVPEPRKAECHIRAADRILGQILALDDRPLSAARPPEKRVVGVCHHFALLMTAMLRAKGLHFLDIGTSGGVWGLARGYSLMIGGEDAVVRRLDPILAALVPGEAAAPPTPGFAGDPRAAQGYVHAGANGAGHFTKMVHNGIEYGMMQAFAEGLDILKHADSAALPEEHRLSLNLGDVTEAWRRGSVVASWLLDLTAQALAQDPELESFSGHVSDSGEGRWTVQAAVETAVPAPVLSAALFARFASRDEDRFSGMLQTGGMPQLDLLVRTSGEVRLSNFLLWEAAYAELYFTDVMWPDFGREHLEAALADYARRERRFGRVAESVA